KPKVPDTFFMQSRSRTPYGQHLARAARAIPEPIVRLLLLGHFRYQAHGRRQGFELEVRPQPGDRLIPAGFALDLADLDAGCCQDWSPMNTAKSRFLLCKSGRRPRLDSSYSRRSEMAISVGHFMATSPSSVGKVCTGSPSTLPPPSTPRVRAIQPYLPTASV